MNKKAQWTIGMVNYKTSIYIKWQLKCLYDFNNPTNFNIVIVDNSRDKEEEHELNNIIKPYQEKHNNIQVIFHNPIETAASGQHGEGLTLILKKYTNTKYILFQDPDFFWVKKDILNWLANFLENGKVAIGAPYDCKVGIGHPNFPSAYGCAHKVKDIKHLDLMADMAPEAIIKSFTQYPMEKGFGFSYDVGWKLRQALSSEKNNANFIALKDEIAIEVNEAIGAHSFETITRKYSYKNQLIAYHLFRGSFTGEVTSEHADPNNITPKAWLEARDKFGRLFYQILRNNGVLPFKIKKYSFKILMNKFFLNRRVAAIIRLITVPLKKNSYGLRLVNYVKRCLGV